MSSRSNAAAGVTDTVTWKWAPTFWLFHSCACCAFRVSKQRPMSLMLSTGSGSIGSGFALLSHWVRSSRVPPKGPQSLWAPDLWQPLILLLGSGFCPSVSFSKVGSAHLGSLMCLLSTKAMASVPDTATGKWVPHFVCLPLAGSTHQGSDDLSDLSFRSQCHSHHHLCCHWEVELGTPLWHVPSGWVYSWEVG